MNLRQTQAAIEAILFAEGDAIDEKRIAQSLDHDTETIRKILSDMQLRYQEEDRGIRLIELDGAWQLATKKEYYDILIRLEITAKKPRLTDVLMETLAIIAYKQPVTRIEIEKIRGVSCEHAVNKLLEYDLIKEFGRLDAPGKPILFGTTENFLRCFGVTSISDLPQITPDQVEEYKKEAEAEISVKLDI